jgi:cellulose synthase operon protein C
LPQLIPGARLQSVDLENQDDLDAPVKLVMKLEVSSFARPSGAQLVVTPPFAPGLSSLATLASRETPLFLSEARSTQHKVAIRVALPSGAKVQGTDLKPASGTDRDRTYAVRDRVEGGALVIERSVDIPAGRVAPAEYGAFQAFVRALDEAFERDIAITLE